MTRCLPRWPAGLVLLAAAAPLTLLLTGCQAPSHTAEAVVVLPSATANEPAPTLAPADRAMLYHAGRPAPGAWPTWSARPPGRPPGWSLTPVRADGQVEYGPRRDYLLSQNVNRVQRVLRAEAATGPFDLLQMIGSAVRVTSHPGTLLILSPGCLRRVASTSATSAGTPTRGPWPHSSGSVACCPGWPGGGWSSPGWPMYLGRQPTLPLPQRTTLTAYWMAICHAAGAAACRIDDTIRPDPPSRSTRPVPVVPVPAVSPVTGPHMRPG